jgi:RNase P subunit RPR2
MRSSSSEPSPPRSRPAVRVELHCLMCGAVAGVLEDRRIVRPMTIGSVRFEGKRLACGRCGSVLIPGDEVREPDGYRDTDPRG